MISACEKGAQWQMALGLMQELQLGKLKLSLVVCNATISACEKGALVVAGCALVPVVEVDAM